MSEEEFRLVSGKRRVARRNAWQTVSVNPDDDLMVREVDIPRFLVRLQRVREDMNASGYFKQSMHTLNHALDQLDDGVLTQIVCFGIGPFTTSNQALHQLAFILELQDYFRITNSFYFDPVFTNSEMEVLRTLGCYVLESNCEGKYPIDCVTLFYMPHCPNTLMNNLIWRNWTSEMLSKVVLVCNSFERMTRHKPDRLLHKELGYFMKLKPYMRHYTLPDCYGVSNIFNDLAVHVFPVNCLPWERAAFWSWNPEPVYDEVEMVCNDALAKLSMT